MSHKDVCQSQRPRGIQNEISLLALTLQSWVDPQRKRKYIMKEMKDYIENRLEENKSYSKWCSNVELRNV
jgi:hypothetical protein